jgi:hypothetical protein
MEWIHSTLAKAILVLILIPAHFTFAASLDLPPSVILPNYDRSLIGQIPGLEAGAFVARTNDPSANWYNPAGLIHSKKTTVNTSSSAYGWTALKASISSANTDTTIGAINGSDVPGFFGVVVGSPVFETNQVRAGFAISRELTWSPALQTQVVTDLGGGSSNQVNYSVRDNFNQYVPSVSLAYSPTEVLRVGAGALVSSTSYQGNDSVATQQLTPTSQSSASRNSHINANNVNLRFTAGGQYDITENWKIGLILRSPSLNLWGSTTSSYESLTAGSGQTTSTTFFDNNGVFRYNESFQANVGIAYQADEFEIEGDVRYHAPVGTYTLLSSNRSIVTTSNTGGAPTQISQSFTEITNAFKSVVNFAIGGKYKLSTPVGIHAGFFTSNSPVQNLSGAAFRQVDIYGITAGASVVIDNFSGSLGGAYEWGTSDPYTVTTSSTGSPIQSDVSITSLKILYSISFKF